MAHPITAKNLCVLIMTVFNIFKDCIYAEIYCFQVIPESLH